MSDGYERGLPVRAMAQRTRALRCLARNADPGCDGTRRRLARLQLHALELAVEGFALDVEDLGGSGFVASRGGEDFADLVFFGVGQ